MSITNIIPYQIGGKMKWHEIPGARVHVALFIAGLVLLILVGLGVLPLS